MGNGAAALRAVYEGKIAPEQVDENVRRLKEPGALTASLNWYRAVDYDRHLGPVAVPTFYGWGSSDRALGEVAARATAGYVTGPYHFEIFAGVSHWIPDEVPRETAAMLRDHLGAHAL
jgi:pimeloyl-ACP methyl ester carboxylesterase